jgi:hypothetical protein
MESEQEWLEEADSSSSPSLSLRVIVGMTNIEKTLLGGGVGFFCPGEF